MPPIAKENEIVTATRDAAGRPAAPATTSAEAGRVQPVALEIAVSVNGARPVEGSDKREPFSEATKTVLVFGSGAVIRLQSPVAAGQLLFVTNEKTKKEVVCQVVKSKNYRNVSGYVELEFTEPVVGFWGMRFPGDRLGPQTATPGSVVAAGKPAGPAPRPVSPQSSQAVPPNAVAPVAKTEAPAQARPDATANFNALKSILGGSAAEPASPPANAKPNGAGPVKPVPATTAPVNGAAAPSAPVAPAKPAAPLASDPATEELKQQTARLQEQLASMLFAEAPADPAAAEKAIEKAAGKTDEPKSALQDLSGAASKILDFAKAAKGEPPAASAVAKPATPAKPTSAESVDEVKLPSWLGPLAKNVASVPAVHETSKLPPEVLEPLAEEPTASDASNPLPLTVEEAPSTSFSGGLLHDSAGSLPGAGGSRNWMVMGLGAAALVIASVAVWYLRTQGGTAAATSSAATSSGAVNTAKVASSNAPSAIAAKTPPSVPPDRMATPSAAVNGAGPVSPNTIGSVNPVTPNGKGAGAAAPISAPQRNSTANPAPARETEMATETPEPRKPSLGHVKLAAPKVNRAGKAQLNADADPGIAIGDASVATDALSGVISANASQPAAPAAPIPVGGDVRPAKLITSVAPLYPALARSQHVAGDVKVDALIDANGRVTTMKVVSGPTLLHQAAMDAVRQWKYQPATLGGKAVPMHLTVTIQFRLQ